MSQKRMTRRSGKKWRTLVLVSCILNMALFAGASSTGHVSYTTTTASVSVSGLIKARFLQAAASQADQLVFSTPPQHSAARARELYGPLTEYLSRVTGRQIIYKYPRDWRAYQRGIQRGDYDLVFDNPHFASWRIANMEHQPLVRIAGHRAFVVLARKDSNQIGQLADLAGRSVCAPAVPDLGTLTLYSRFDNPARRPVLIESNDSLNSYQALIDRACDAAIIPLDIYEGVDAGGNSTRVLFKSAAMPTHTLTVGPRVAAHHRAGIARALLSREGQQVTKALCARFQAERLTSATKSEYAGLGTLVRNTWGLDS